MKSSTPDTTLSAKDQILEEMTLVSGEESVQFFLPHAGQHDVIEDKAVIFSVRTGNDADR